MKNRMILILVLITVLAAGAGLYTLTNRAMTVNFDGRTYTLVSHEKSFSDNTFEYDADDGSKVTGANCLTCGGMVVTYTAADGTVSAAVTGKVTFDNGEYQEGTYDTGCGHNVGAALSETDAHSFVETLAKKESTEDSSLTMWIYWSLAAVIMTYGAWNLGRTSKRVAKWMPIAMLAGGALLIIAMYADLLMA